MKTLNIRQNGLVFNFFGTVLRTPVVLDITKYKIADVICSLNKWGITNYSITESKEKKKVVKKDKFTKTKTKKKDVEQNNKLQKVERKIPKRFIREKQDNKIYNMLPRTPTSKIDRNKQKDLPTSGTKYCSESNIPRKLPKDEYCIDSSKNEKISNSKEPQSFCFENFVDKPFEKYVQIEELDTDFDKSLDTSLLQSLED